jgi:hypothetical protein
MANRNIRTGRYSKDLPTNMLGRYEEMRADRELLQLRDDIAVISAQIGERLAEVKEAEANPDLERIVEQVEDIQANWRTWEWTRAERELAALSDAITNRQNSRRAMAEVNDLIDRRARLVAQENKRLAELRQTMTLEQGLVWAQALVGIVRRNVLALPGGTDALRTITAEFREVLTRKEGGRA